MKRANIGWFAREVLKRPLYPYQEIIGNAILDSILNNQGLCFTVMISRQGGKNQTSAAIENILKLLRNKNILEYQKGSSIRIIIYVDKRMPHKSIIGDNAMDEEINSNQDSNREHHHQENYFRKFFTETLGKFLAIAIVIISIITSIDV